MRRGNIGHRAQQSDEAIPLDLWGRGVLAAFRPQTVARAPRLHLK